MNIYEQWTYGSKKHKHELQKLTEQLQNILGINHIGYVSLDDNNQLINLHSNIEWLEYCLDKKYYLHDPCMVNPSNINTGYAFYFTYQNKDFQEGLLTDSVKHYNMAHEIVYVHKNENQSYEAYSLTAPMKHIKLYNIILNEPEKIKLTFKYLRESLLSVKQGLLDYQFDFSAVKGDLYNLQRGLIPVS